MSEQAYITSAREALETIRTAITEAEALLPDDVLRQQWIAMQHTPNTWESVGHWYYAREDFSWEIADTIAALKMLSGVKESLFTVIIPPQPGGEQRLKLAKVRRTA